MDCSPPVFSVHGILQERILKWVAISFSRGSSWPSDRNCVCCPGRWILYHRTILEADLYLGAKKILNLHWSSLYFNLYFMYSVHFLNIFITSPTIFWGKEPMLLPMSFMSFLKNSTRGSVSRSLLILEHYNFLLQHNYPHTCILLLLLSNSIWFSQAPTNHRILALEDFL